MYISTTGPTFPHNPYGGNPKIKGGTLRPLLRTLHDFWTSSQPLGASPQGGTVLSSADCTDVPRAFRATLAGAPGGAELAELVGELKKRRIQGVLFFLREQADLPDITGQQ